MQIEDRGRVLLSGTPARRGQKQDWSKRLTGGHKPSACPSIEPSIQRGHDVLNEPDTQTG